MVSHASGIKIFTPQLYTNRAHESQFGIGKNERIEASC